MKSPDMHRRAATLASAIRSRAIVLWHEGGAEDFRASAEDQDIVAEALSAYAARDASRAALDVLAERQRQVEVEGWDAAHDDEHRYGEMAAAAACYAYIASLSPPVRKYIENNSWWTSATDRRVISRMWPGWARSWFKPVDCRRDLVRAGALILAEIERLDRASITKGTSDS